MSLVRIDIKPGNNWQLRSTELISLSYKNQLRLSNSNSSPERKFYVGLLLFLHKFISISNLIADSKSPDRKDNYLSVNRFLYIEIRHDQCCNVMGFLCKMVAKSYF